MSQLPKIYFDRTVLIFHVSTFDRNRSIKDPTRGFGILHCNYFQSGSAIMRAETIKNIICINRPRVP